MERAFILVKAGEEFAECGVLLTLSGSSAPSLLIRAVPRLVAGDPRQSLARLVGVCHDAIGGNLGLAVVPGPADPKAAKLDGFRQWANGDSVYLFDCATGELWPHSGNLAARAKPKRQFLGRPPAAA